MKMLGSEVSNENSVEFSAEDLYPELKVTYTLYFFVLIFKFI